MSAYEAPSGADGAQGTQGDPGLDTRLLTWTLDPYIDAAVGDAQAFFFIPEEMDGWVLVACHAGCDTVGTASSTIIQIRNVTQAVDMLTTRITIDANENHSKDATTPVIDGSNDDVAYGDKVVIDIDQVATGTRGVQVQALFQSP